jgi:ethanolamine ammonia-lyase large subunit
MTVGEFRKAFWTMRQNAAELKSVQWAIIAEIAAAVAKIADNKDLHWQVPKFAM